MADWLDIGPKEDSPKKIAYLEENEIPDKYIIWNNEFTEINNRTIQTMLNSVVNGVIFKFGQGQVYYPEEVGYENVKVQLLGVQLPLIVESILENNTLYIQLERYKHKRTTKHRDENDFSYSRQRNAGFRKPIFEPEDDRLTSAQLTSCENWLNINQHLYFRFNIHGTPKVLGMNKKNSSSSRSDWFYIQFRLVLETNNGSYTSIPTRVLKVLLQENREHTGHVLSYKLK